MDLKPGDLVISKAGRDKGKIFIVMSVHEPDYVKIVDGKLRSVENPKLKKMKHVQHTEKGILTMAERIRSGDKISNSDIRKALASVDDSGVA